MTSQSLLTAHILRLLGLAHGNDEFATLDTLVVELGIRRADVRSTLSQLHRDGILDVARMRLTMHGLALAASFAALDLAPLRSDRTTIAA